MSVVTGTGGHKRHLLLLREHPEPFPKDKSLRECQRSLGAVWDGTDTSELPHGAGTGLMGLTARGSPSPGV